MFKEFKTFILRGNVMDLAVGVIVGAAFSTIVTSLITDVITPWLLAPSMRLAHVEDLEKWGIGQGNTVKIGKFLAAVINFILTAFILFIVIKAINKATSLKKKKEIEEAPKTLSNQELLLTEIRDLLKK
jgi:large conductance mechanosensitive channel